MMVDLDNIFLKFNLAKERIVEGEYKDSAYFLEKAGGLWTSLIGVSCYIMNKLCKKRYTRLAQEQLTNNHKECVYRTHEDDQNDKED